MAPQVVVVCSTCQPRPAAGDGWTMSIMVDKELPHLIQPVAQALFADRSLVSKLTRQRVCCRTEKGKTVSRLMRCFLNGGGRL